MSTMTIDDDVAVRRTWQPYGCVIVVLAAIAMAATFPGRTFGLGMFSDGILRDFSLTEQRGFYGWLNLWATLLGALFCLPIGWLIDRIGSRAVLTGIYVGFGVAVLGLSHSRDWLELFGALIFTRGLGQSALSVVSITMVAKWFRGRSLNVAMACYSVLMSLLFAFLVPTVSYALQTLEWDWREILTIMGWTLCALAPISLILARSKPRREDRGGPTDGSASFAVDDESLEGATLRQALKTPTFWVFSLAVSFYGLISSGISLFNAEIFRDNELPTEVFHNSLVLSLVIGMLSNFLAAWLSNRWGIHRVLAISMAIMTGALTALPLVRTSLHAYLYATAMAVSGGVITLVFFAFWGQAFGRREVGRIQSIAQMLTVLASAVGPFLFGHCRDLMGSYVPVFVAMAPIALVLSLACWFVGLPKKQW